MNMFLQVITLQKLCSVTGKTACNRKVAKAQTFQSDDFSIIYHGYRPPECIYTFACAWINYIGLHYGAESIVQNNRIQVLGKSEKRTLPIRNTYAVEKYDVIIQWEWEASLRGGFFCTSLDNMKWPHDCRFMDLPVNETINC